MQFIVKSQNIWYGFMFQVKDNVYSSILRVNKLEYFDRGFVECIASNGVEKIRSIAFLEINPEAHKYGKSKDRVDPSYSLEKLRFT